METIEVHTFHSNGNDVVCKRMHVERVNDNILYVSNNESCCGSNETYYYLIVGYNNTFALLHRTKNLEVITDMTFDKILEIFKNRVESKLYFNKVELILCKAISNELYESALSSRAYVLERRAEEEREKEEKRKKEEEKEKAQKEQDKIQKQKEREEKKKKNELFFLDNSDILKDNLSNFERLTAIKELNKLYRFHLPETNTEIVCSILDLIRKHSYCKVSSQTEEYAKYGVSLKVPKTYYYIGTAEDSLGFQIPAKLGKIMTL